MTGMYITMFPLILGGIFNMIFTKTNLYKQYRYPIDGYRCWRDKRRIFGDHKTVIGFISMIVFLILFQIIWGFVCSILKIEHLNDWYHISANSFPFNLYIGFLVGLMYMLCELPNSFMKRRLGIEAGKKGKGLTGAVCYVTDQIDSLVGVFIILKLYSGISFMDYFFYILLGGITHIAINVSLYLLRIRRDI